MKKIFIISIVAILFSFNVFAFGDGIEDIINKVTDINCIMAYQIGSNIGTTLTLEKKAILEEMKTIVDKDSDNYEDCYKAGLICSFIGDTNISVLKTILDK